MKEVVLEKHFELEKTCSRVHMEVDSQSTQGKLIALFDYGNIDPSELLASMDDQIA